jgi:phytoene dehydrogenase-like protein
MSKSIIIIGAGIAGLSAGCYGRMNGYETKIFELHDKPGGLCTSWKRYGRNASAYTFDGCIHWLVGSKQGSPMNAIWQELGATQDRQMVDHDEFMRYRGPDGKDFVLYTNVDQLEQHLKELSPADTQVSAAFCNAIRRMMVLGQMGEASGLLGKIKTTLKMIPFMLTMARYRKTTVKEFALRFSDPFLRQAFAATFGMETTDFPIIGLMMTLAWMHNKDAGYPIGGSLEFARAIEKRYLDLGGQIHYKSRVEKILVENNAAVGVRLTDDADAAHPREHRADVVISAADGHATIFDMLEGKYVNDTIKGYYDTWPIFQPIIQVSLGVARDLSQEPHSLICALPQPIRIAEKERSLLSTRHFCYDPTMAPAGKSAITVMFVSDHAYWKELAEDPERYEAEKKDIAIKVIEQLEQHYPGITDQVEAVDVATPLTYERYTGNWQGSMEGWMITTETMGMSFGKGMDKTLPGLENLYMIGQWVEPGGGLPPAATSARKVIGMICKRDDKEFKASLPAAS